jgi:hypothetical protein
MTDLEKFKDKWMIDAFYWLGGDKFQILQEIAFQIGITWHTGDTNFASENYPHNNLWFSKDGKIQSLPFWNGEYSYGQPKDFDLMLEDWKSLKN